MLPYVILHNVVSIDGRMDHFTPDLGLYYELASNLEEDATLLGCDTLLSAPDEIPPEDPSDDYSENTDPDGRPLLVVPDSRGRLRSWHYWRALPFWRDAVALCSRSTPQDYLEYLDKRKINRITTGDDHADLTAALKVLYQDYGIRRVRVDSGGTLNGVLLRSGLVDEISLLIHPCLVGGESPLTIFRATDLTSGEGVIGAKLTNMEKLHNGVVWLRYILEKREP